ncbi:helix-turn-helix transcriptional regulator [Planctobacterium marinum]|uniref:DNA-binding transcriptional regulator n=1 Tax=Planctobacterium marinum TaxID=1631968 RepID=A0AA48HHZ0_9ALTE|nr:DNA-binding transcriptional regulator [Planctobacterium marinum]
MKKAERLFSLFTLLASRRTAITAEAIADVMEISIRTVYRDIRSLQIAGVNVEGEPGVGYLLGRQNQLAPLMFTPQEALALLVGSQMTQAFTDPDLQLAAQKATDKFKAVLPESTKLMLEKQPYCIPVLHSDDHYRDIHAILRKACEQQQKIRVCYCDKKGQHSERTLWPLGIIGWFGKWTLLAWCELRSGYRNFLFDSFSQITPLPEHFQPDDQCSLQHYLSSIDAQCKNSLS